MQYNKPMKSVDELIDYMETKGIRFTLISKVDAKKHLDNHNNYFKLTSYRKNYEKFTTGSNAGKYSDLEFAYLIELARIDTEVRHLLLEMSLDIEHFLKVMLIKEVENQMKTGNEDGYSIISQYLSADDISSFSDKAKEMSKRNGQFTKKISQSKHNPYCGGLVESYSNEMPIWAFVELCSFGDLNSLITYYSKKTGWKPPIDIKTLDRVRQLRNACAHGNSIIYDLHAVQAKDPNHYGASPAPPYITNFLINAGISKTARSKKMSNPRINQIVHLLYAFDLCVTSSNTRKKRLDRLNTLIEVRLLENKSYFVNNQLLSSAYDFFKKIHLSLK